MYLKFNVVTKDMRKLGYMTSASDTASQASIQNQVNELAQAAPLIGGLAQTLGAGAGGGVQDITTTTTPRF